MSNIPNDQLAGYCCPMPALQFDWLLGTESGNLDARIVALTNLRCLNCGTTYKWKSMAAITDGGKTIILDVEVPPVMVQ